jgi:hypothetical protein
MPLEYCGIVIFPAEVETFSLKDVDSLDGDEVCTVT